MKNIIKKYIPTVFIAVFIFTSCEDFLDYRADDQLTLESVFENVGNVESWLGNIYSRIPDTYGYGTAEPCGDDFVPSPRWEQFNFRAIQYQKGNWTPMSEGVFSYWTDLPRAIRSAYILIENIKPLHNLSKEEVELMKAECEFFIGYYHALLLMTYGSIPIIDKVYQPSDDMNAVQQPFDKVVDWIDLKLQSAATKLPPRYTETRKYGRITSVMCYAIRARLLTFAASPLVNGNSDFSEYKNSEGIQVFNATEEVKKWQRAAQANKDLIELAEEAGHELYKEYLSDGVTIDPFMSYQNVTLKRYDEGNMEILMDRPYSGQYGGWDKNCFPRGVGGVGALGVSQTLVDDFFMKDGTAPIQGYVSQYGGVPIINPSSQLYTEIGFSAKEEKRLTKWREGSSTGNSANDENIVTLAGTYNMYCNREARFYVSVLYNEAWTRYGNRKTDFYMNGKDGGPTHDAPQNGYLARKKVDVNADPVKGTYKSRTAIIYRLAEAYLSYAEALNESNYNENLTEILKYINLVRERAGIPQYGVNGFFVPANQTEMRKLIRQERRVELNCESFLRFDDIRRWKEGYRIDGPQWGMNFNGKLKSDDKTIVDEHGVKQAFFIRDTYFERKFISYWWPIPQNDVDKNPNIKQLPGW